MVRIGILKIDRRLRADDEIRSDEQPIGPHGDEQEYD